jgi:hypothetical protein
MGSGMLIQLLMLIFCTAIGQGELYRSFITGVTLPPSFSALLRHPWSLVTYPFFWIEYDVIGILVSALVMYSFGQIHQQLLGDLRTQRLVVLAIPLVGLLTVLLSVLSGFGDAAGSLPAGGGTVADGLAAGIQLAGPTAAPYLLYVSGLRTLTLVLVFSSITLVPDDPIQLFILGQIRIVWIGVVLLLLAIASGGFFSPVAIAAMVAALLGFLHVYFLKNGHDLTAELWGLFENRRVRQPRMTVKQGGSRGEGSRPRRGEPGPGQIPQETIDGILDKISAQGYESLSREEKELLFKASIDKEDETR